MNFSYELKRAQDVIKALLILIKLKSHEKWTREQLAHYQRQQLKALVSSVIHHSPFYRELYKNVSMDREIELSDLPIIDKATMMENFDRFVTDPRLKLTELQTHIRQLTHDEYYLGEYRVLTTSGSSGLKGVFVFSRKEWSTILAGGYRASLTMDIPLRFPKRLRESRIYAGNPVHASHRMTVSGRMHIVNTQSLSATSGIESHVYALNTFQPEGLSAYPSIASLLAIEQIEGRLCIHPSAVVTAAETRTREMESNIQAAWNVRPFEMYGTTEGGAFNIDCPYHRGIHISEDLTIMEVVDEKNQPVPDGLPGYKVLITNLFNYTQPLIRYEVSDMLAISKESCPCGRPFRLIAKIEGRNNDILYLPGPRGRDIPVHPLHFSSALGIIKDILEYRVVHEDKALTISVVLRKGASGQGVADEIRANLAKSFEKLGINYFDIVVLFLDKIERDPNAMGKVKLVQSNVKKRY